ncbi:MAG TPA: SDR family oxidoreductase [Candidatus Limnocylindrales bacterium]|nr:SDR family oxidoreductase [Candidatus Limnocylindrales bacterium]
MSQIALVTGANKGIGYEISRLLLAAGVGVLIGARSVERGRAAATSLGGHILHLDVTDEESIAVAAKEVEHQFGVLDILVNNAGIGGGFAKPSATSLDDVRRVFDTNLFGAIAVTNAMLPLLRRSHAGRIVNVSSELGSLHVASDRSSPIWGLITLAYPASKSALNMMTVQYAKELIDTPIKVNAVTPGYTATDFNGGQGFRTAAQAAEICVSLALLSDDGPTGTFIDENGTVPW